MMTQRVARRGVGDAMGANAQQLAVLPPSFNAGPAANNTLMPSEVAAAQTCNNLLSAFDSNCWSYLYQQANYGSIPNAPGAAAVATSTPPTQAAIDAQTPEQTVNQIVGSQNTNATAAAQQTIADATAAGTYNPAGSIPTVFGMNQSTTLLIIAVARRRAATAGGSQSG